jgi:hypothetical protein
MVGEGIAIVCMAAGTVSLFWAVVLGVTVMILAASTASTVLDRVEYRQLVATGQSPTQRVLEIVNRERRKLTAGEVGDILRADGYPIRDKRVRGTLQFLASRRGGEQIQEIELIWYVPREHQPEPADQAVRRAT